MLPSDGSPHDAGMTSDVPTRFSQQLARYAEEHVDVRVPKAMPDLSCGVLNGSGARAQAVAQDLAVSLDVDFVLLFDVAPPSGPVHCRIYGGGGATTSTAAELAQLFAGGEASNEAIFTVPHLDAFQ